MLIFGGWNGSEYFNDVHVLDLQVMAWKGPETSGPAPSPRKGHCAVLIGSNLVIQGGFYLRKDSSVAGVMGT